MPGCSVIKCRSQGKGLHTFPADPALRRQWILFCRRSPDWTPGRSARLCNDHFRPTDLKSWSGRVKDTAVPTIELCRRATETSAKRKKVGVRTNGVVDFIWKGPCSWHISMRTNQYSKSFVPRIIMASHLFQFLWPVCAASRDIARLLCRLKKMAE